MLNRKIARPLAKAITWRVVAFFFTAALASMIMESVKYGLTLGLIDSLIKIALYYAHERVWEG